MEKPEGFTPVHAKICKMMEHYRELKLTHTPHTLLSAAPFAAFGSPLPAASYWGQEAQPLGCPPCQGWARGTVVTGLRLPPVCTTATPGAREIPPQPGCHCFQGREAGTFLSDSSRTFQYFRNKMSSSLLRRETFKILCAFINKDVSKCMC